METERRFRNAEERSIEATITFPIPIHATLTSLSARIDGRMLQGQVRRRAAARAEYEAAIDTGRTAVLHEEALRGVHMLSIGHIPPGAEIAVISHWIAPLDHGAAEGMLFLRIPTGVGDIYGRSPLPASDDLIHADPTFMPGIVLAELTVTSDVGSVHLRGSGPIQGQRHIRLDAPIDLVVTGWSPRELVGIAADGRVVQMRVAPDLGGREAVSAAILVDRSASMRERADGDGETPLTKHDAVINGLRAFAETVRPNDAIQLWEFDDKVQPVPGATLPAAIRALQPPRGGTEIGLALSSAASAATRDVVLLTDGKSHALDVQALARTGRRFSAVLIGEDSLAANVGHLAALTGGTLLVATGADVAASLRTLLVGLRRPHIPAPPILGAPTRVTSFLGGIVIEAAWTEAKAEAADADAHAIGAFAAALALPGLDEPTAAALAEAHGIVCHLTSLVLVDMAGELQDGLPAQRKVPLPTPRTASIGQQVLSRRVLPAAPPPMAAPEAGRFAGSIRQSFSHARQALRERRAAPVAPLDARPAGTPPVGPLRALLDRVDWSLDLEALRRGEFGLLPADIVAVLQAASALPAIVALARTLQLAPMTVALALVAQAEQDKDRGAARFARATFRGADRSALAAATLAALG